MEELFDVVDAQDHPGAEGDGEDRTRGEREGAHRRARIQLTEAWEDQGKEGGGERGPLARSCALRFVHRG